MNYSVDINEEYRKVRSKFLRASLLFSLILTVVIVADVLLVVLAKDEYRINMIIAIVITSLFSWFAIYFFTNVYSEINARYRYFKGYDAGIKPTDEVIFIRKGDELCYINGLYAYPVWVNYYDNLSRKEKVIYTVNGDLDYQSGDKLTITTYQRILVRAEKHVWKR